MITTGTNEKSPRFESGSQSTVHLRSNFIHAGSYVTTVVAYDPITATPIEDYSIVDQVTTPNSEKNYFKIDQQSGTLYFFPQFLFLDT